MCYDGVFCIPVAGFLIASKLIVYEDCVFCFPFLFDTQRILCPIIFTSIKIELFMHELNGGLSRACFIFVRREKVAVYEMAE